MATGLRVLIVEDHKLFAEVIRSTLERLGMEVVASAPDARQGLEAARRERPELVLVDIGLPDESGLTLGRKILEEVPEAKIVAVTALNDRTTSCSRISSSGRLRLPAPLRSVRRRS